jgi:heme A synthase
MGETARVGRWVSVGAITTVVLAVVAGMVGSGFVSVGGRPGAWGVLVVDFLLGLVFFFFFFFFAMLFNNVDVFKIFFFRGGGRSQMSPKSSV